MPDAFRVDPDALADAVERMSEYLRYSESMLSEIDTLVSNLHGMWSGEAAAAHVEAHRHWASGEAMMREALGQLKAAGATAHHNYTSVMAANMAMWS
ncbi:MAG: WXG100 family type VII secretion target [Mycobacterium sp.]|nr:WXG100 family type VII secretion target [Mycobacterium sp.]